MARPNKPWYWEARGVWCVKIDGRRHVLARGPEGKREAAQVYHRLMADRDRPRPAPVAVGEAPTVRLVMARFLADCRARAGRGELAEVTFRSYRDRLKTAGPVLGDLRADEIRPKDVHAWLDGLEGIGSTRRHDLVAALKTAMSWARGQGWLAVDPIEKMKKPARKIRREEIPTAAQVKQLLDAIIRHELRILVEFLLATGCRPGEAARLEARHFDLRRGVVTMPGKTTRKTGMPRSIVLPPAWWPRIGALAQLRPTGPLFLNSEGQPWTSNAIGLAIRRARHRAGLGKESVAYALRHRVLTDLLEQGTPLTVVAAIGGHKSATTTARIYAHVDQAVELMRSELAKMDAG
jgi:integrase